MMKHLLIALVLLPAAAIAEDWRPLNAAGIAEALTGQRVVYASASQRFYASGRTLYIAGRESWGQWAVRGDRYCSQWPPADEWTCYDIAVSGEKLRFISVNGDVTDGVFVTQ